MADPITWRSINAPDFRASASSMAGAAETFKDAFGGLQDTLKGYKAEEEKFAAKRTKDNTAAYLTHLASIQDPAAAEAALKSGQLTEMLRGYGSEIDAPTAIAAKQSLLPTLQQRAVQAMQFEQEGQKMKDYRTDLGQRDTVSGLQEALLRASTPDEVNRIKQALGIYQSQGYVDNRAGVDIIKNAAAREGNLVTEARAAEKHGWDSNKAKRDEEMFPLEKNLRQAQINQANASAERARNPVGRDGEGKESPMLAQLRAARDAVIKDGPLGDGTIVGLEGRKNLRSALKDTLGLTENAIEDVIEKVYDTYGEGKAKTSYKRPDGTIDVAEIDIPIRVILEEASKNPEWLGNGSFWSRKGDTTLTGLKNRLSDPELIENIRQHTRLQKEGDYGLVAEAQRQGYAIPSGKGSSPKR